MDGNARMTESNFANRFTGQVHGNPDNFVWFHLASPADRTREADVAGNSTAGHDNSGF